MQSSAPYYNAEQKRAFIAEKMTNNDMANTADRVFRLIAPMEAAIGRDFCTLTADEAAKLIERMNGELRSTRWKSIYRRKRVLFVYSKWCVETGVPGAQINVNRKSIDMKIDVVRNPCHLQMLLDEMFEPESEQTADNTMRCAVWLVYGGMRLDDAVTLTADNIDLIHRCAVKGEAYAELYKEAIPCVENCVRLDSFRYIHPLYPDKEVWKNRVDGDEILRGVRSVGVSAGSFVRRFAKRKSSTSATSLNFSSIRLYGIFYRLHEMELASGESPNLESAAIMLGDNSEGVINPSTVAYVACGLRNDYARWKESLII